VTLNGWLWLAIGVIALSAIIVCIAHAIWTRSTDEKRRHEDVFSKPPPDDRPFRHFDNDG